MTAVVLVIHIFITIALVATILLQRSEGGALGMGGGPSGLMSGRAAGNVLSTATSWLGGAFFVTSIVLAALAGTNAEPTTVVDEVDPSALTAPVEETPAAPIIPTDE